MKLSDLTLESLKSIVTGEDSNSDYMTGPELVSFFNNFGTSDTYDYRNGGLPNALSRNKYALSVLKKLNGERNFINLIEALVDNRKTNKPELIVNKLNDVLKYDGYTLVKNDAEIYKVCLLDSDIEISTEAYFDDIKEQILESIRNAKYFIWVAVAWFTDKDLGNELRIKHLSGVNIRVIVNDDNTTTEYGLDFNSKGIEYIKLAPNSIYGKKLMHNKFCIIDMKKVIHGSYNWTSNAKYNKETITITKSRELSERFALEFTKLVSSKY